MNILKLMMFVANVFSSVALQAMRVDNSVERQITNLRIARYEKVQSIHDITVQNMPQNDFLKWRDYHIQLLDGMDRDIKRLEEELQKQRKS
ncbi:MAG TPA: hypothetical protein VHX42_02040 [Candidatus Babeliales bacterium]|jgi:hypothetical protein|nr:hypothetical protein [Candidatus Babeliales bacterium]